jgi:hypothetical protein
MKSTTPDKFERAEWKSCVLRHKPTACKEVRKSMRLTMHIGKKEKGCGKLRRV